MQKIISFLAFSLFFNQLLTAQSHSKSDSSFIVQLNQQIDANVIIRNIASLDSLYADDFIMTHGDGRRDRKTAWLTAVAKSNYSVRLHDSVTVELHPQTAIVKGRMLVQKAGSEATAIPYRRYIRLFVMRKDSWQLISHFTIYDK